MNMKALSITRRTFLKAAGALAAVLAISSQAGSGLLKPTKRAVADSSGSPEILLTSCHDTGPFIAHVKDGRWFKSSPLEPNLPIGHNGMAVRNRVYSADRIRYPMKRADFDVNNRNTQNRGKLNFVRISWDEAITLVANEIQRVKDTYGPSAFYTSMGGHTWRGSMGNGHGWKSRFFSLLGGFTNRVGGTSTVGWKDGAPLIWGGSFIGNNNYTDILQNGKIVVYWSTDPATHNYGGGNMESNRIRLQLKAKGIKIYVIDTWLTDTAGLFADKFIHVIPGTDEAMMAAIAYTWIKDGSVNTQYLATHTVGYDQFEAYVLGTSDGVPKTPEWAEAICGVDRRTIVAFAREWASNPLYIVATPGGANRRANSAEWVRMLITLQAMLGYIGKPGAGVGEEDHYGSLTYGGVSTPAALKQPGGVPGVANNVNQSILHVYFPKAVLDPPINWTTQVTPYTYPQAGYQEIHLIGGTGGTLLNQIPGINGYVNALQSPKIEFIFSMHAWWESSPSFSDVVLPVCHTGERDDIMAWRNYVVYMHKIIDPLYESKNDFDVFVMLADKLGIRAAFDQGKDWDAWMRDFYSKTGLSMSYDDFKAAGFYKFNFEAPTPKVTLKKFADDPDNNKLATPSGKIEIFSQRVKDFYGDDPEAPAIPKYIVPFEGRYSPAAQKYPLDFMSPHSKFARHSQWQNMGWQRDEPQVRMGAYMPLFMNPADAEARGIKNGDVVKVYNDRGAIKCGAKVTERVPAGVVWTYEGGYYKPAQPGVVGSIDNGGDANVITIPRPCGKIEDGMCAHTCSVEVQKWSG